ncbi:MAG: dihydroorotate dehydrogenase [Lentisphaeria bacterium]|nr:dihydroorotate dehydrogenase [Lentisphaeria bacterium]
MPDLSVKLGPLNLKNPVMTASGTFGYGMEYEGFFPPEDLGAVVVKGVTTRQVHGNPTPRVAEVVSGMLNAIGLQGPGVDKFLHDEHYLPGLRKRGATVIVNIWGRSLEEYQETAAQLDAESEGIAALEINVSCPNVKEGGISFSADPVKMASVITAVRNATKLPIITKLSPNGAIPVFAKAAEDAGSDMLSMINTIPAMAIDIETHRPKLANVTGGLSGPCVKPVGIKAVYDAAKAVKIPIIGMGGIETWRDAAEYLIAGASAIAVGTATFTNPMAPIEVVHGLDQWLDRIGAKSVSEVIGTVAL